MLLKENWIKQAYEQFKLVFTDSSKKEILEFLSDKFDEDFKEVECVCYNNYEQEEFKTNLSSIIDWEDKVKPIITMSGTFFKRHSICENPNAVILKNKLDGRKIAKNEKFRYKKLANVEQDPVKKDEYKELSKSKDLEQSRLKVQVNSEYGVDLGSL